MVFVYIMVNVCEAFKHILRCCLQTHGLWSRDADFRLTGDTYCINNTWWRHQMETFSALLATCAGNSPVPDEFSTQRPVTRSFDVFFDLRLNKRLSKQWRGWWFETLSCPLWRHRDDFLSNGDIWGRFNVLTTTTGNPTHAATNNWIVSFVNVKFKWFRRRPPLNNMYLESYSGVLRAVV